MLIVLSFLIGLIGAGLITAGAWLFSPIAGLVCGGCFCLLFSYMNARANSSPPARDKLPEDE